MTQVKDDAADYQRRRWLRPNAHLYIRHDAYRFAPPGSPFYVGRDVVKYFWPDPSSQPSNADNSASRPGVVDWTGKRGRWMPESDDASLELQQEREIAKERANLLELKSIITAVRRELAWQRFQDAFSRYVQMRLKAGFNPAQPRVPANNPDGGQWTTVAGNDAGSDSSDFAQDQYLNSHILGNHVAKTDGELKERIRRSQYRGLFVTFGMDRNGSFDSIESARDFIKRTLDNNLATVSMVASGRSQNALLTWRFGYETGKEAYLATPDSDIRMRKTYEVGVIIAHDPRSEFGYRVITAYPRNFNPRSGR